MHRVLDRYVCSCVRFEEVIHHTVSIKIVFDVTSDTYCTSVGVHIVFKIHLQSFCVYFIDLDCNFPHMSRARYLGGKIPSVPVIFVHKISWNMFLPFV